MVWIIACIVLFALLVGSHYIILLLVRRVNELKEDLIYQEGEAEYQYHRAQSYIDESLTINDVLVATQRELDDTHFNLELVLKEVDVLNDELIIRNEFHLTNHPTLSPTS